MTGPVTGHVPAQPAGLRPSPIIALDLDQTLIFSTRTADLPETERVVWVEDYDGQPLSLMTERAHALLEGLTRQHLIVPTTTRTIAQYERVRLPVQPRHAICANGGIVLDEHGQRDPDWDAHIASLLPTSASTETVLGFLRQYAPQERVRTIGNAHDLFAYLVTHDRSQITPDWVQEMTDWAVPHGLTVSVQGRKIYLVPAWLTKAAAAWYVASKHNTVVFAAGDSLLDLPLLTSAALAVRPPHGELANADHAASLPVRLGIAGPPGARATETILTRLSAAADAWTATLPGLRVGQCPVLLEPAGDACTGLVAFGKDTVAAGCSSCRAQVTWSEVVGWFDRAGADERETLPSSLVRSAL